MEGFVDPVAHAAKANPVAPAAQVDPTVPVDASSAFKQRVADVQPQSINPFVLPVELWLIIFGFLDETTQAIAMHVCHEWHTLIMNISLAHLAYFALAFLIPSLSTVSLCFSGSILYIQ